MKNKNAKVVQIPLLSIKSLSLSIGWQKAFRFKLYLPEDDWEIKLYSWMVSFGNIYIIKWRKE